MRILCVPGIVEPFVETISLKYVRTSAIVIF